MSHFLFQFETARSEPPLVDVLIFRDGGGMLHPWASQDVTLMANADT